MNITIKSFKFCYAIYIVGMLSRMILRSYACIYIIKKLAFNASSRDVGIISMVALYGVATFLQDCFRLITDTINSKDVNNNTSCCDLIKNSKDVNNNTSCCDLIKNSKDVNNNTSCRDSDRKKVRMLCFGGIMVESYNSENKKLQQKQYCINF
ncbi:hypothetical protein LUA82_03395 [Neoehrlichia mikurensis]|uniref:Uncharacterized protein n=1 Tax=Neoehrlichia mikurensis TaxID=89586 RepID=A0A9Q9BXD4_9RICK|nr:hypothetical protein [Neoehrlichia mikurensis]UTO55213.1 hypothetical protein LUA82_03395 [Neoehrlichia mikurensis]